MRSRASWIGDGGRSDGGQTPPASGTKRAFGVSVQVESLLKPTRRKGKPSEVPRIFTTAFGDPGRIAERAAAAEARKAEVESQLIPTPARFAFAFGRPDILAERRAERLAKWQWSDEFLAKARPDQGNYGEGDVFDDGLTKLERAQIEQGREAYLTGGAKLRYKRLTGQI